VYRGNPPPPEITTPLGENLTRRELSPVSSLEIFPLLLGTLSGATFTLLDGGLALWLGRRSVAGGLSLIYA